MKDILALIGVICMLLASAVTIIFPLALAIWVSPVWLWVYAVYILFTIFVGVFVKTYSGKGRTGGNG